MKEKMTIGEFAKLKQITTETLRYYDRVGLLKPAEIDPITGYRYYSIFQFETLSTILDLRQLGMSIDEIRTFFANRSVESSLNLLMRRHAQLLSELDTLHHLEQSITQKIAHLQTFSHAQPRQMLVPKSLPARRILRWKQNLKQHPMEYGFPTLEKHLQETAPIFAANRYGLQVPATQLVQADWDSFLFVFLDAPSSKCSHTDVQTIPSGTYLCSLYQGYDENFYTYVRTAASQIPNLDDTNDIIIIAQLDLSVAGCEQNILYEIQFPIS